MLGAMDTRGEITVTLGHLIDTLAAEPSVSLPPCDVEVFKTRFVSLVVKSLGEYKSAEWWCKCLFLISFVCNVLVTAVTGASLGTTLRSASALAWTVLALSSVGTLASGLREQLKLRDTAVLLKELHGHLLRCGFLFLTGSGRYGGSTAFTHASFQALMGDVERLQASYDHLLRAETMDNIAGATATAAASTFTTTTQDASNIAVSRPPSASGLPPDPCPIPGV